MGFEQYDAIEDERRLVADIAASLETAMSTRPSADFLARVRGRVAEERERAAMRWPASLSGIAASVTIALAVIGAFMLGRVPPPPPASRPAATAVATPAAAAATPSPGMTVPSVLPRPAASTRHRREARAVAERPGPRAMSGAEVLVDPGQRESLARLVERGPGASPLLSRFVVETLDPTAPLPQLRPAELPRFEPKRLEMKPGGWHGSRWEAGGAASDGDEGSDS